MALQPLTLTSIAGVQNRRFQANIEGLNTGNVEILNSSTPGFSTIDGSVMTEALPYDVSTLMVREYDPGASPWFRDSRIDITGVTRNGVSIAASAAVGAGRTVKSYQVAAVARTDGTLDYVAYVEDDLGATVVVPLTGTAAPSPTLGALSLSAALVNGMASSGTVGGATAGSTIASNLTGLMIDSGARTYMFDGTAAAASYVGALTETLAGATNSPRSSDVVVASGNTANPPVLTRTTTAGTNPMSWSGTYSGIQVGSDYIRMRWRVNGGTWTYDTNHLFTSDDYLDSEDGTASFSWPAFQAAAPFAGGALVEVQEGILRGSDPTVWSVILSDTMAAALWVPNATVDYANPGYSFGRTTFTQPFGVGTAIVGVAWTNSYPAGVTVDGVATTLIGTTNTAGYGVSLWRCPIASAGPKPIVVTPAAGTNFNEIAVVTGTIDASLTSMPSGTAIKIIPSGFNQDPQTMPALSVAQGGLAIAIFGPNGNGSDPTWITGIRDAFGHGANGYYGVSIGHYVPPGSAAGSIGFQVNGYSNTGAGGVAAAFAL